MRGLVVEFIDHAAVVAGFGVVMGFEDEQDGGDGVAQGVVGRVCEPAGEFEVALAVAGFDGEVAGQVVGDDADGAGIRGVAGVVGRDGDGNAVVVLDHGGLGVGNCCQFSLF